MTPLWSKSFKKKTDNFVSINLGNRYIKGLVVKGNKVTDYFLEEKGYLSVLLKEIWQKKRISTDKVKISIKDPSALIRYFSFPKIERKKLREALFYDLSKHIPFPPDKVYFDYAILEEISATEIFVLLAVAKKEFIDNIVNTFEKENLKISEISVDSACLIKLFLNVYKNEKKINNCILDIGYTSSVLTILRQGMPFLTRNLEFSTKDILEVVSRLKSISSHDVEEWVLSLKNYKDFLDLIHDSIFKLCKEVKSSFDYFELNKGERIEKLYLTGGLASIGGIESLFKESLDVEVSILNNFQNLNFTFPEGKFAAFQNSLAVAIGLIL